MTCILLVTDIARSQIHAYGVSGVITKVCTHVTCICIMISPVILVPISPVVPYMWYMSCSWQEHAYMCTSQQVRTRLPLLANCCSLPASAAAGRCPPPKVYHNISTQCTQAALFCMSACGAAWLPALECDWLMHPPILCAGILQMLLDGALCVACRSQPTAMALHAEEEATCWKAFDATITGSVDSIIICHYMSCVQPDKTITCKHKDTLAV